MNYCYIFEFFNKNRNSVLKYRLLPLYRMKPKYLFDCDRNSPPELGLENYSSTKIKHIQRKRKTGKSY